MPAAAVAMLALVGGQQRLGWTSPRRDRADASAASHVEADDARAEPLGQPDLGVRFEGVEDHDGRLAETTGHARQLAPAERAGRVVERHVEEDTQHIRAGRSLSVFTHPLPIVGGGPLRSTARTRICYHGGMTTTAFPGHAGRWLPLTRWRSLARIENKENR